MGAPNSLIGIGKSNNFVETFTVGVFIDGKRRLREWSPIIPKSVLYVYADDTKNTKDWSLKLLINPTGKTNLVLLIDAVILLVLGLVIIVLYFQEKAEDEKDSLQSIEYF